jgi:hypothetical protein
VVLLYGALLLIVHRTGLTRLLVASGDGYQTLMQVLPATVIGIYALAFGSVFVAAQLVAPARGSRSLLLLLLERRFRTMVVATLVVAVGSVLLAGQAPEPGAELDPWVASAAAALAVLTVLVVICFTLVLVELFGCYNSPRSFAERLRYLSLTGKRQLPPVISAVRQWLCTAARAGRLATSTTPARRRANWSATRFHCGLGEICAPASRRGSNRATADLDVVDACLGKPPARPGHAGWLSGVRHWLGLGPSPSRGAKDRRRRNQGDADAVANSHGAGRGARHAGDRRPGGGDQERGAGRGCPPVHR